MASPSWKDEVESLQSIFPEELRVEDNQNGCLLRYSIDGSFILEIKLDGTYPEHLPEVTLSDRLKTLGLNQHIQSAIQDLCGSPVVFNILTSAKEWIDGHPFSVSSSPPPSVATTSSSKSTAPVCRFFAKGTCKFGNNCKNYHPGSSQPSSSTQQDSISKEIVVQSHNDVHKLTAQDSAVVEKTLLSEKEMTKKRSIRPAPVTDKPVHAEKDLSKKGSMRTAADVISRIKWDPDLPTEKFSIGYLDRFVGVIEKPFSAFSWEDLATVAPNVLAVPEHRIQYFKYRDEIVWDKSNQFDNVFGSRGGMLIQDVIQAHSEAEIEEKDKLDEVAQDEGSESAIYKNTQERPTHFICYKVRDQNITAQAEKVQNHILKGIPDLSEGCVTALHVTVCLVQLKTEHHKEIAKQVMESTKQFFTQYVPKCTDLVISGVDNFHERLVYAKVEPNKALDRFSYFLIERLQEAGLKTPGNYDVYTPHMTLVKMSRPLQRTIDMKAIRRDLYSCFQDTYFGREPIEGISLCSMTEPKQEDGFFLRLHDVSNSLLHLSPSMPSLFSRVATALATSGVQEARDLDFANNVTKFDNSVEAIYKLVKESIGNRSFTNALKTKIVILRGLPGSGKSYLAKNCSSTDGAVCSSDEYFVNDKSGLYQFDPKHIPEAHAHCCKKFVQAIADNRELVIVDNTNSMKWEYRVYTYLCEVLGLDYHILEIPHPNMNIVSAYLSRNVHNLTQTVIKDYTDRWEDDVMATLVPPMIAYPKSSTQAGQEKPSLPPSLLDIYSAQSGRLPDSFASSSCPLELFFTGIFLTPRSQWDLVSAVAPTHSQVYAEHVTLIFKPDFEALKTLRIGKKVALTVWGVGDDGEVQAVEVDLPNGITCLNEHPHITISTVPSSSPKYSNSMLSARPAKQLQSHLVLEGIVGVAVKDCSEEVNEYFPILSKENFVKKVVPQLSRTSRDSGRSFVDESISIATCSPAITKLFIFDFDGTLFDSPYPEPGKLAYKKATGREWTRKGWWGVSESLLPPLTVPPGPALANFRTHHGRVGCSTVILTARKQGTMKGVSHVLAGYDVHPDVLILKPDDFPADYSSSRFKTESLKKLLVQFPEVKVIRLWEDNEDNLEAFRQFASANAKTIHCDIIDSTRMNSADEMLSSSTELRPFLSRCGVLASPDYYSAASIGIQFIAEQFGKVIGFNGDPAVLARPIGSYCFGRRSDVDMLVLAPPPFTPVECMEKLCDRLEACSIGYGNGYIHKGYSSRCPRLKVKLTFFSHSTIEYDIIFAILNSKEALKSCSESTTTATLEKLLKKDDQVSKRAFLGLVFLHKVKDIIRGIVTTDNFGVVVEMVVQILKANRLKGNCYRCIHTFHIIQLLADFVKTYKKRVDTGLEMNADVLFREFISHSALLPSTKWEKLCGEFAAKEYIPRLIEVFQKVSKSIQTQEGDSGIFNYEDLLMRSTFPSEGYTPVKVLCSSSDQFMQWELDNILEARLPTYISQLLSNGLEVIPEDHRISMGASFAVKKSDSSAAIIQDTFRKFWNEFSDYRKRPNVHMELKLEALGTKTLDTTDKTVKEVMKFLNSDIRECHLPATMTANERRIAHETAEQLGVGHKTEGEGKDRHIRLFKLHT